MSFESQITDNTFFDKQTELAIQAVELIQKALASDGLTSQQSYKVQLALKVLAILHKAPTPGE